MSEMATSKVLVASIIIMAAFTAAAAVVAYNTYNATQLPDTIQPEAIGQPVDGTAGGSPASNSTTSPTGDGVGSQGSESTGVVVERKSIIEGLDLGFLKSIKYVYSEEYLKGYIVNVTRVGVEDYCSDCVLLLQFASRDGSQYYIVVYGDWYVQAEYEDDDDHDEYRVKLLTIDELEDILLNISEKRVYTTIEAVESNLEYKGHTVYIGYEIEPRGWDIELVSAMIGEYEEYED